MEEPSDSPTPKFKLMIH